MQPSKTEIQEALEWIRIIADEDALRVIHGIQETPTNSVYVIEKVLENALKDTTKIKMIGKVPEHLMPFNCRQELHAVLSEVEE
jgi:hypothetical protein